MRGCISEKEFNEFLEGSIDPSAQSDMEAHAGKCDACARALGACIKLKASLDEAGQVALPDGFKVKVMSRVEKVKIMRAPAGNPVRRGFALAFVAFVLLYLISRPLFGTYIDSVAGSLFKAVSAKAYAALEFVGIDPAVVLSLFGGIMSRLDDFIPFFVLSTALMIISFLLIIIRGKSAKRHL